MEYKEILEKFLWYIDPGYKPVVFDNPIVYTLKEIESMIKTNKKRSRDRVMFTAGMFYNAYCKKCNSEQDMQVMKKFKDFIFKEV